MTAQKAFGPRIPERGTSLGPTEQNQHIMNATKEIIKGNWNELKGKLKQEYAKLTDSDLLYLEGKEDELLGRLQQTLGKSKEEVDTIIARLSPTVETKA